MANWLLAAFPIFVVLALVAHGVARRGIRFLSIDEKARLVDSVADVSLGWFLAAASMFGGWFVVVFYYRPYFVQATIAALIGVLLLSVLATYSTYRQFRRVGMPSAFLRSFLISRCLRIVGASLFFLAASAYVVDKVGA